MFVFAIDGAGYHELMLALHSGKAPHLQTLLGDERQNGRFAHGYSVPNAFSILPSPPLPKKSERSKLRGLRPLASKKLGHDDHNRVRFLGFSWRQRITADEKVTTGKPMLRSFLRPLRHESVPGAATRLAPA